MDERDMRSEYKRIFDGIHASDELRRRILEQKPKKRSIRPYIAAASSVAAGVMIFAAVYNYDFNSGSDGVISETAVTETERPAAARTDGGERSAAGQEQKADEAGADIEAGVTAATAEPAAAEGRAKKTTEDYKREALERAGIDSSGNETDGTDRRSAAGQSAADSRASENSVQETKPSENGSVQIEIPVSGGGAAEETEEKPEQETAGTQAEESEQQAAEDNAPGVSLQAASSRASGGVLLNVNSPSVYEVYVGSAAAGEYSYGSADTYDSSGSDGYVSEQWDNSRYFDYIGADIVSRVTGGTELEYTGDKSSYFMVDESGVPVNDSRIFVFEGENGKYVSVITSRDTIYAETYLSDPDLQLSDVDGISAVVFDMDGKQYKCYMIFGGTSYTIDTEGLDEDGLSELLLSIVSE